jgi:uncharacterized protein (TIGR02611 family)
MSMMRETKRILKIIAGFGLLLAGLLMLALPGPGWLTIAAGLAMLANEFPWARRLLDRIKAAALWTLAAYRSGRASLSRAAKRIVRAVTERFSPRDRCHTEVADEPVSSVETQPARAKGPRGKRQAKRTRQADTFRP